MAGHIGDLLFESWHCGCLWRKNQQRLDLPAVASIPRLGPCSRSTALVSCSPAHGVGMQELPPLSVGTPQVEVACGSSQMPLNTLIARRARTAKVLMPQEEFTKLQLPAVKFTNTLTASLSVHSSESGGSNTSSADTATLSSICKRRGVEQLQIRAPPPQVVKVPCKLDVSLRQTSASSSLDSVSTGSLMSDTPSSLLPSDLSMDEWGFITCEFLGAGSMGSVYKVVQRSGNQEFAAKHVCDSEYIRELREEYELMKMLCHDNIIRPTQFYERYGDAWLCMELCKDGSVEDRIVRHGAFQEQVATVLAKHLLEGLNYLCGKRIVHRDIKPMNLLLSKGETHLKIADFNCAKRLGCHRGNSAMLSERGTQLYAAPELRLGLQWNERIDVWACGLCIFMLLRAQQPLDLTQRRSARLLQQGCLPCVDWGAISNSMANLVRQCLTVEMRDRPSPMELLEHCVLSGSKQAALSGTTKGESLAPSLAACGILMLGSDTRPCSSSQHQAGHLQALRDLAARRYLRVEGWNHSSCKAWTSPI